MLSLTCAKFPFPAASQKICACMFQMIWSGTTWYETVVIRNYIVMLSGTYLTITTSFSLSQCSLSMTLYYSLFDNKILCLSLLSFGPSQSPTPSLSLSPSTAQSFIPFHSSLYPHPSITFIVVALLYIFLSLSASLLCAQCIQPVDKSQSLFITTYLPLSWLNPSHDLAFILSLSLSRH